MSNIIVMPPNELIQIIRDELKKFTFQAMPDDVAELERLKRKEMLTTQEVQKLYSVSAATLATMRSRGGGPGYHKVGGSVCYKHTDIKDWINSMKVKG